MGTSFKLLPQSVGQFTHQPFAPVGWIVVDAPEDDAQVVAQVRTVTGHQLMVNAFGHAYLFADPPYGGDAFIVIFASFHSHTMAELLRPHTQFRIVFLLCFIFITVK